MNVWKTVSVLATFLVAGSPAAAASFFEAYDEGAGSLAAAPNSVAAAAAFDAATGGLPIIDFESPLPAGVTVLNGSTTNNSGCAAALCGYNTSPVGDMFRTSSGGSVAFTFDSTIDSFGVFLTGWQLTTQTYAINGGPQMDMIDGVLSPGGTVFWGVTGTPIDSVTFFLVNDIVSFDDVRWGNASSTVVPLPAPFALLAAAFGGLALFRKRA